MAEPVVGQLSRADAIIAFCEEYLCVPEGAHVGRPMRLREWQKDAIREIYGSPTRLAILSFARKNGKTALTAMLVLAHLVGPEARRNAQIYSAAQSRDQASIVFSLAAKMVRMCAELNDLVTVRDSAKELYCHLTGVRYKALSADATTAYGLSPALVIHDELGQVRGPRSELYDALETAMGAQAAPMSIVISTQAPTDGDLLSMLIDDAKVSGDSRIKLVLYASGEGDDPWSEGTWRKANPALGDFRSLEDVQEHARKAKRLPAFETSFRNLFLNQRIAVANHVIPPDVWTRCGGEINDDLFVTHDVYAGLDLSARQDLTALALVARDDEGVIHARMHFFAPENGLRERAHRDRAAYDVWADRGLITLTPGNTVNYGFVAQVISDLWQAGNLRSMRYDRWRIDDLLAELDALGCGLSVEPHGQGFRDMSPAIDELETLALNGQIRHGGNPVLTMCVMNAVVVPDEAGNRKFAKNKSTGRIDGIVALAMAVMALLRAPEAEPISPWEDPEFRFVADALNPELDFP